MDINEAAVILRSRVRIRAEQQEAFRDYIRDAFPVIEAAGDTHGAVYVVGDDPETFDEVFYYRTEAAYQAAERAIVEDPVQVALLQGWRGLLHAPPEVTVLRAFADPPNQLILLH